MLATSFAFAASANAETIDVRAITCAEVATLPDETLRRLAVWLDGYLADDEANEDAKIDLTALEGDAADIKAYCLKNPATTLLRAAEALDD